MSESGSGRHGQEALVRAALASWRDSLVNLSGTNRLLNFRQHKTSTVPIAAPSLATIVGDLKAGRTFRFHARDAEGGAERVDMEKRTSQPASGDDPAPDEGGARGRGSRRTTPTLTVEMEQPDLARALRTLMRRSTQEYLDRGLWVLYMAVGSLSWADADNTTYTSPLLLIPVELVNNGRDRLPDLKAAEEDPVVNPALTLKLTESGIALPSIDDLEDTDPERLLEGFVEATRQEKSWTVHPHITLSYFTFAKEAMYRDLLDNEAQIAGHPAVAALAAGGRGAEVGDFLFDEISDDEIDRRAPADGAPLVLDADSSQRACVAAALEGRSFVMDGPPGTGKSQTIANMIGALMHAGKSILFVSEKAAALDVVRNRMSKVGLDSYLLELHSHKATRRQVADALGIALETVPVAPPGMSALDTDQLRNRQSELNAYAEAMNVSRQPLDQSLHTVLGWIAGMKDVPAAPATGLAPSDLGVAGLSAARAAAKRLAGAWRPASDGAQFIWRDVIDRRPLESHLYRASSAISRLHGLVQANEAAVGAFGLHRPSQARQLHALLRCYATRPPDLPEQWLVQDRLGPIEEAVRELIVAVRFLEEKRADVAAKAGCVWSNVPAASEVPELDLSPLDALQPPAVTAAELTAADAAGLADNMAGQAEALSHCRSGLTQIAQILALPVPVTFDEASWLVAVASIADAEDRPESHWLIGGLADADHAARALADARHRLDVAESEASAFYTQEVLERDVEALHERFTTQHLGLRKLGGVYRRDKREVAAFARDGVPPQDARQNLALGVAWRRAADEYREAEVRHAPVLGEYYTGRGTDYMRLARALETACRLVAAHPHLDLSGVAAQIARGRTADPRLHDEDAQVRGHLHQWRALTTEVSNPQRGLHLGAIEDAGAWLRTHVDVLRQAAAFTAHIDGAVGRQMPLAEARELVALRSGADDAQRMLFARETDHRQICGELFAGDRTDCDRLGQALTWVRELRSQVSGVDQAFDPAQVRALADSVGVDQLGTVVAEWSTAVDEILAAFGPQRRVELAEDIDDYSDAAALVDEFQADTAGQDEWFAYLESREELARYGLATAIDFCISERVPASSVPWVLDKALLREWADHQMATDPALRGVRSEDRDSLVTEYRDLDRRVVSSAIGDIIRACNARRPRNMIGQSSVIRREADKKRKHMPVRQLLARTAAVAQAIKPCFMMSPLAVSQYLPPDLAFDIVIFDEASQVPPQDAINCIYRGESLITCGDQKQLPPTNFFGSAGDDSDEWVDEEDDATDFDSILDLAKASGAYKSLTLKWHYRSRHENLIAFSNASFYRGKLITFPGADHEGPDVGVELFVVPGVYRRGSSRDNPVEASTVAERVFHHYATRPNQSVGVVTFSESQAALIENAVEEGRGNRPELERFFSDDRLDGFFVKSLESVQGDERDVMIFSLGYGPDENGKMTMQFGPLTRNGGWRRLNVAITRARYRNEIISSFRAAGISDSAKSEGVRHLRRYLDFAERGASALTLDVSGGDAESPFEESVLTAIRSWGYEVTPQVGAAGYRIDIGVQHPDQSGVFVLGVECDGFQYHSSKVARDRDRLRDQVLGGLGWNLHRIWGTAWYRNRNGEEERLRAAIETAANAPVRGLLGGVPHPDVVARPDIAIESAVFTGDPEWTSFYEVARPARLAFYVDVSEPASKRALRVPVEEVVRVESPVHVSVLHERIKGIAGVSRIGHKIRANIDAAIQLADVMREGDFLTPSGGGNIAVRTPTEACARKIEQIHDHELSLALVRLARDAGGISEDELTAEAARLFGWSRRGPDIGRKLRQLVGSWCDLGVLVRADGGLTTNVDEGWSPVPRSGAAVSDEPG